MRIVALVLVMALAVLAMIWPFRWPSGLPARSQLSYCASLVCAILALLLFPYDAVRLATRPNPRG
jgi:hypothetical protein